MHAVLSAPADPVQDIDPGRILEALVRLRQGDTDVRLPLDWPGLWGRVADAFNEVVAHHLRLRHDLTRLSHVVGKEGRLKERARVPECAGFWTESAEAVNSLITDLVHPTSEVARVIGAVAQGDLSKSMAQDIDGRPLRGEFLRTARVINRMVKQLGTFAAEVTRVAREVGTEGKLGGQADVQGVAGTWKDLTDNVNQLAANLTTQVRAIAEVAMAVTQGDLTRSVTVQARGEVAALKDTINEMIRNLRDTTRVNTEQDWLKTNLAKFSRLLQGQKEMVAVGHAILSELAPVVGAQRSGFYVLEAPAGAASAPQLRLTASYAGDGPSRSGQVLALGEGLVGQCALDRRKILLAGDDMPASLAITTGLGSLAPRSVLVLPIVFEGQVRGVLELASAGGLSSTHLMFLDQLAESIGIVINTLEAKTRTEDLLAQSQSLAHELQSRQLELQHTNQALQEKARQVALTSKYKSEFLANMSHELRTPLNSLLILSEQLSRNPEGNLSARQVEFAKTIHSSGNDLLMLINDILDLSKIESGTVVVEPSEWRISDLQRYLERNFRHVAEARGVTFRVDSRLRPSVAMRTDIKRLQQILKNLLSNAFKFTQRGTVRLAIEEAREGWTAGHASLQRARRVIAFAVSDTGIGISADKQQIIFDAFQQADGSTSRKYGGTGLGLAISRELSRLLGGEIRLSSVPGQGSTFTLYLPLRHRVLRTAAPAPRRDRPLAAGGNAGQRLAATRATLAAVDEAWPAPLPDDRDRLRPADAVLLVAEGDPESARALTEAARGRGFKVVATPSGAAALAWASLRQPSAIVLGAHLSDMDGSRLLDRLKHDLMLRHLPVCQVAPWAPGPSAGPDGSGLSVAAPSLEGVMACLPAGADPDAAGAMLERLRAYVVRRQRRVLIALKELALQRELLALLEDDLIQATVTRSAERLVAMLGRDAFDAVVLDAAWLAADSERLRAALCAPRSLSLQALPGPMPVLVHGCGGAFPWPADWNPACLAIHAAGDLTALFDRTVLALHHPVPRLPEERRALLQAHRDAGRPLTGKRVLIVDDDMRNIFALASVLEAHGMDIVWADNGRDAIDRVAHDPQVAVVLMDIMMPELDGLATMREIRQRPRGRDLPLIAVTAKAMKGDRERCIEAGAWDYLSKPVNPHELLTALRAWVQP